ncbi:hypothetical protein [Polymorphobacter sp.]|uniref:hypothetical protein n=1 Tax=Polymorphobacter sp. TaxID=1909290 RepID=UPI003F6FB4F4
MVAPALAADTTSCASAPGVLRQAAATADAAKADKALRLVAVGEKLCAAGGRGEAAKKFTAAARALDTDLATIPANAPSAQ